MNDEQQTQLCSIIFLTETTVDGLRQFDSLYPHNADGSRTEVSTKITVSQSKWDPNKGREKGTNDDSKRLNGSLARLSSPNLYYSLSGNDFSLDINNPDTPKIVSLANNPQNQETYGPILSLYMTRLAKIINQKKWLKSSLIIDEFPTLTFLGLDTLIATGRSNKISTTIAIQDSSQLRLHYGKEMADVIVNICGNIIVGQVGGELAKQIQNG